MKFTTLNQQLKNIAQSTLQPDVELDNFNLRDIYVEKAVLLGYVCVPANERPLLTYSGIDELGNEISKSDVRRLEQVYSCYVVNTYYK